MQGGSAVSLAGSSARDLSALAASQFDPWKVLPGFADHCTLSAHSVMLAPWALCPVLRRMWQLTAVGSCSVVLTKGSAGR